jgi:hypothetical protein
MVGYSFVVGDFDHQRSGRHVAAEQRHPHLHAVAVLQDGRPVGLVNRRRFVA